MAQGGPDLLEGLAISDSSLARLSHYGAMLEKWNPAINLVGRSTVRDAWGRHFMDSAQLLRMAPKGSRNWADLGSGGGFPGLVLAILLADENAGATMTLVESDLRKATFLRQVASELNIPLTVKAERIEQADPLQADVLTARALAPLSRLSEFASRHLAADGVALFPKGTNHAAELAQAVDLPFDVTALPSLTGPDSVILRLTHRDRKA